MSEDCSDVEKARRVFVALRQSRKRTTKSVSSDFQSTGGNNNGGSGAGWEFLRAVNTLPSVATRLRHLIVENQEAEKIMARWDKHDTVMYLDPPYVGEARNSKNYGVESAGLDFHEALVETVLGMKSRVILSGYDHPVYHRLNDWHRTDTSRRTGSTARETRYKTETLWMNYEPESYTIFAS